MRDAIKGLRSLLAGLDAQKSRGWTAHNEFDYFTLCPTCGHWFDCRDPENLIKHRHQATASIVVTTIAQRSGEQISGSIVHSQNPPSNAAIGSPDLLDETPDGGAKS